MMRSIGAKVRVAALRVFISLPLVMKRLIVALALLLIFNAALSAGPPIAWRRREPILINDLDTARRQTDWCDDQAVVITRDGTFVQPDYARWQKLNPGMTEAEVLDILGPPISGKEPAAKGGQDEDDRPALPHDRLGFALRYGWLDFAHPAMPKPYYFSVLIQKGKVLVITDPFHHRFSRDGTPTVPELLSPAQQATIDPDARFVDLRWVPSSGVYPMEYEVALEIGQHYRTSGKEMALEYRQKKTWKVQAPYAATTFPANPCRCRVRASNELGTSEWSDFRYFSFEDRRSKAKGDPNVRQ